MEREEEIAWIEALEEEIVLTLDKEMLEEKVKDEKTTKMVRKNFKISLKKANKITALIRTIWNIIITTNLGIMQVSVRKRKVASQGKVKI